MKDLKVYYKTSHAMSSIDSLFDKEIKRLAERFGLKFQGQGVEVATGIRDIHYAKEKK